MTGAARQSFARRLVMYANERFPLAAYLPMILIASFAATGFSRVARGADGFVSATAFATTALTLLAAFFTLRVADEHKDADVDRVSRPELPVPRGLVSLGELRWVSAIVVALAVVANALLAPKLLVPLGAAGIWLALMTREFFVREWLRERPAAYLVSHMMIMPLLMLYATAVDWLAAGVPVERTIAVFLAATFATGLVLEIGRKIRSSPDERPGVETYSSVWGPLRAVAVWMIALAAAAVLVAWAGYAVGSRWTPVGALVLAVGASLPAVQFLRARTTPGAGKRIEAASSVWTIGGYGLLGLPWLERAIA